MRLYKFIYDLGVNQERQRIKNVVLELHTELTDQMNLDNAWRENDKTNPDKVKRRMELNQAILYRLDALTRPTGQWIAEGTAPIDGGKPSKG